MAGWIKPDFVRLGVFLAVEHQFESKATDLREEYLSIMLQIHKLPER
jgi:hypothetical protein